jgi:hypothetical protein
MKIRTLCRGCQKVSFKFVHLPHLNTYSTGDQNKTTCNTTMINLHYRVIITKQSTEDIPVQQCTRDQSEFYSGKNWFLSRF